jgi:hypothetical protein
MIKKILHFFLILFFFTPSVADIEKKIILNLKKTNNLNFNFKQTINDKKEN